MFLLQLVGWVERSETHRLYCGGGVADKSLSLMHLMKQNGPKVIEGRDHNDMIAAAKRYIDGLLG